MYSFPKLLEQLAILKIYYQVFLSNPQMSFLANIRKNTVKVQVCLNIHHGLTTLPYQWKKCLGNSGLQLAPLYQNTQHSKNSSDTSLWT